MSHLSQQSRRVLSTKLPNGATYYKKPPTSGAPKKYWVTPPTYNYYPQQPLHGNHYHPHMVQPNPLHLVPHQQGYMQPRYNVSVPQETVLPKTPDVGMVAEFKFSPFEYKLGVITEAKKKSNSRRTRWVITELVENTLPSESEEKDTTKTHTISERDLTFLVPNRHQNNTYHFKPEDLPALLERCQLEVEKYRNNIEIIYGSWLDAKKTTINTKAVAEFIFGGSPRPHEYYVAHRILQESTVYFKQISFHRYELMTLDKVEKEKRRLRENKEELERERFLHRLSNKLQQTSGHKDEVSPFQSKEFENNLVWNPSQDHSFVNQLKNYALATDVNPPSEKVYTSLLKPLNLGHTPKDVFNMLVNIGILSKNENPHHTRYPHHLDFTPTELKMYNIKSINMTHEINAVLSISNSPSLIPQHLDQDRMVRRDLRGFCPTYTIDSDPNSNEIDDAVGCYKHADGSTWIVVHIADPSRFVSTNDDLDLLVRKRVQSTYLPEKSYPLFPPSISRDHLSLLPDKVNFAMTYRIKLSNEGEIQEYELFPSVIDSVSSYSYREIDEMFENKSVHSNLQDLFNLAEKRHEYRVRRGALFLDLPRPEIFIKKGGEVVDIQVTKDYESYSRRMVSELMILVGEVTAKFAKTHSIPIPYRSQGLRSKIENPEPHAFVSKNLPVYNMISQMEKMMQLYSAQTEFDGLPHHGLALQEYCQTSSPIRRYSDLVVHQQIKAFFRRQYAPFLTNELVTMFKQIERNHFEMVNLENKSKRFWIIKYLEQQNPERIYRAMFCSTNGMTYGGYNSTVWIMDLGWRTAVVLNREPEKGVMLSLSVHKADAFNDILEFKETI